MKKKINKKTIPAYAFGMDQLNNYLGGANLLGSATSGLFEEGTGGDIAGGAISAAASGASAGMALGPIGAAAGGVLGAAAGLFTGFKKKKAMEQAKKRKRTMQQTELGLGNAASAEGEYWDDNSQAYTFANGGVLPNLAYLDNNEIVRDDMGNIAQVPNTRPGTDNHLVDASSLDSVLSDKLKRPGTKNTFAKEGKMLAKMTKPSKGTDSFAENTNRLNKINANKAYNRLLEEQEAVKEAKGVKPKVKGIPAYEDGFKQRWGLWNVDDVNMPTFSQIFGNAANKDISAPDATVQGARTGLYNVSPSTYNKNAAYNTAVNLGSPTTGTWFTPNNKPATPQTGVDGYTYASEPSYNIPQPTTTIAKPSQTSTPVATSGTTRPMGSRSVAKSKPATPITRTTTQPLSAPRMPMLNTSSKIDWPDRLNGVAIPKGADDKIVAKSPQSRAGRGIGNIADLSALIPTAYNMLQGLRGPEEDPLILNPYMGAVSSTMARRRSNIEPAMLANSRSRAISNYNLANMNANTGANLATRTQSAVNQYAANADMYANKQNADNVYLGEYANTLNNLGQQYAQARMYTNEANAKNRAASRTFGANAAAQLGKWSQINTQMNNQYSRDEMMMPFLANFLQEGYTSGQVNELLNRFNKKR